ncbi:MAG: hypothetical protein V4537_14635 [Pseudomonadota bacterium]
MEDEDAQLKAMLARLRERIRGLKGEIEVAEAEIERELKARRPPAPKAPVRRIRARG